MAIVTRTLLDSVGRQIKTHGTVVWYDPEEVYRGVVEELQPEPVGAEVIQRYDPERGFIWLRHELEMLWAEPVTPPRLLIYVPLAQSDAKHALIEFEEGGVVMRPGQQPPQQNTALAVVAREALRPIFPAAKREEIVAEVEAGKLSLAELDQIAEKGSQEGAGAVGVIFGTGVPAEVALRFLTSSSHDGEIEAREALESLSAILFDLLGVSHPADQGAVGLRARLARQVLMTDFVEAVGEEIPPSLQSFKLAEQSAARQAAVDLAQTWRNRRDLAGSYVRWARKIEAEIGLGGMELSAEALFRTETFLGGERMLQTTVEQALLQEARAGSLSVASLIERSQHRRDGFWSLNDPTVKTRWDVIIGAGEVLLHADRVERALKGKSWPADALVARYAYGEGGEPWCALDTAQRHLERDYHRFDLDPKRHDALSQLVARARHRYTEVANDLASAFVNAYADADFILSGVMLQADVYRESVEPAVGEGSVAYLHVDALRFEMAREFIETLVESSTDWDAALTAALATPPTVTRVGMAALLPGAERGIAIQGDASGLAATLSDEPDRALKTRKDRVSHFMAALDRHDPVVMKLRHLTPVRDKRTRRELEQAGVVLVTAAEEIDGLCESNPSMARRMLDDIFTQLRRGLKALFDGGIRTVIITADHGYLFGERLTSGQGIDPPGGQTVALKRRVWVGRGGARSESYLRRPLSDFGLGGDLEIATPWNLSCFKVPGGATEYFHGGLSLPEIVIPVLTVCSDPREAAAPGAELDWTLTPGSPTISTRFFSVTIEGRAAQLLPLEPPLVRVEMRADDQAISVPVSATYGFRDASRDVQLQRRDDDEQAISRNTVTLMITEEPPVERVTIYLLNAETGVTLARLEDVPLEISL